MRRSFTLALLRRVLSGYNDDPNDTARNGGGRSGDGGKGGSGMREFSRDEPPISKSRRLLWLSSRFALVLTGLNWGRWQMILAIALIPKLVDDIEHKVLPWRPKRIRLWPLPPRETFSGGKGYDDLFAGAKRRIDILGVGWHEMRQHYSGDPQSLAARARVRVILVNNRGRSRGRNAANARDRARENLPGTTVNDVTLFLTATSNLRLYRPDRFTIKLQNYPTDLSMIRVDNTIITWYEPGTYGVTKVYRGTPRYYALNDYFDNEWRRAKSSDAQ